MELNEYQKLSERTMPLEKAFDYQFGNYSMGISGEAGEVTDAVKKILYHGHELNDAAAEKIAYELGDVLFYIAAMAKLLGYRLDEIATMNIEKLKKRYPGEGFDPAKSINRVEYGMCVHEKPKNECAFCKNFEASLKTFK